jgi:hypothetical protein
MSLVKTKEFYESLIKIYKECIDKTENSNKKENLIACYRKRIEELKKKLALVESKKNSPQNWAGNVDDEVHYIMQC